MYRHVHVTRSAEDQAAVKTMSGWMIPFYATMAQTSPKALVACSSKNWPISVAGRARLNR